jgi:hypothetical protein
VVRRWHESLLFFDALLAAQGSTNASGQVFAEGHWLILQDSLMVKQLFYLDAEEVP